MAVHITSAVVTAASGTKYTPSGNASTNRSATASASRVFPVPPGPVSVTRRTPQPQHRDELGQLPLSADQRCSGSQQARRGAQALRARELRRQPFDDQLGQAFRDGDVLQLVRPQIPHGDPRR